jgi:prepilin-type N-terminal cleavage/methylation domain-containing protein
MVAERQQRRARSDDGFTLVELMASLTLIAVGIVGVIGVMNSSFRVVGSASGRAKATAVATKWVEYLRSLPYDQVVPSTNLADPYVQKQQEPVGGLKFTVKYAVTWENEATPPAQGSAAVAAYKKAVVWVTWRDPSGFHDVYQSTLLYPGGLGVYTGQTGAIFQGSNNTKPLKAKSLSAVPVTASSGVDLSWVPPDVTAGIPIPAKWIVQYSRASSFLPGEVQEVAATIPGSVTTLRVTDLADNTRYYFRIFAKSESGVLSDATLQSQTEGVLTGVSTATACSVGTASVTPSAVKKRGGSDSSRLVSNPKVEVQLLAACSGTTFEMEYFPDDGVLRTVALAPVASRPGTLAGDINGNEPVWVVGDRPINVYSYTAGVKKARANLRLVICDNSKATCP